MFYAHALYPKMLVTLNTIAAEKLKRTQETAKKVVQLLNYTATHTETITRYHNRGMNLYMNSNK